MTVNRTTLLNLPLPVTGTESGLWGDYTNNGFTEYVDTAVAGALSITASVTLANTTGTNSATGITTTTAQYRTLVVPAAGVAANVVITAPSSNRTYHIINRNATYTVQVRAGTNSGVTIGVSQSATVGYDSVAGDYVLVGPIGPTVPVSSGGTGATTLTANNVIIGNGTSAVQFVAPGSNGNVLTSNGTTWTSAAGSSGTVTSVSGTGSVQGLTLSGTVTSSGSLALGGSLSAVSLTSQVSGTLPVGNGGTGVTSSTGSGSVVLSTSPSLTTPVLGTPTSGTLSNCTVDGTDAVGFRNIPQNVQTGSYTLVLADSGKHIYRGSGSAATWTIPANSSVAYAIGTALTFINLSATSVSIAITSDTMYLSSAGTTGTRTLAQYGSATAVKIASTTWIISGSGLT